MRNYLLYFSLFVIVFGCSVDHLPGCEGNGAGGEICKEYQYVDGNYNGLNNYFYDESGKVLLSKITMSKSGSIEGSVFYNYNNEGRLVDVEYINSLNNVIRNQSFEYHQNGSVSKEENVGDVNDKKLYYYDSNVLIKIEYFEEGILVSKDSMEYFTNTNDLYRTINYKSGIISTITYDVWYGSSLLKKTVFDAFGVLQSSSVRKYNINDVLIEEIDYSSTNAVQIKTSFKYDSGKLYEIEKEDGQGRVFEKLVYQRF